MFGSSKDRIGVSRALVHRAEALLKEAGIETLEARVLFSLANDVISGQRTVTVMDILSCTRDIRQVVAVLIATRTATEEPAEAALPAPSGESPKG